MPPDENASAFQVTFNPDPISTLLLVSKEGEILEMAPNPAEWPPECRPMGLMAERLQSALSAALAEAGEMRALLKEILECADVYREAEDEMGRGWCSELSCYLRGKVGMSVLLTKAEFAALERIAKSLEAAGS